MVALVAEAAKLPRDAAQSAVGLAMIAVAFMTVLQSLRLGPIGSGYLWTHQFTGSIISMAVVVAVARNALFLLGTWQYSRLRLGKDSGSVTVKSFDAFFEKQAKEWKISAEPLGYARSSTRRSTMLRPTPVGPWNVLTLRYTGNLPSLPDARPSKEMVEEQNFVSGLTDYLSGLHADHIERSAAGERCEIKLLFRL
jgi:hypothetical protein